MTAGPTRFSGSLSRQRRHRLVLGACALLVGLGALLWLNVFNASRASIEPGSALSNGSPTTWSFRTAAYFSTPIDVAPLALTDFSPHAITIVKVTPAGLPRGLVVTGGFLAGRCVAGNTPVIVEYDEHVRSRTYLHTWTSRQISMVPTADGYCCHLGMALPRCGPISSPLFPVITLRATHTGKLRFDGFNVLYRSGGSLYREFVRQRYTIDSLGACHHERCNPLAA